MEGTLKLVAGLGNPGRRYEGTRHNVGYVVLAELARRHGGGKPKAQFQAEVVEARIEPHKLLLLAPTTYMNLSGTSVLAARDFYKISDEDLLIVCDDFNLPLGKLRIRPRGSAGGQKGLADVIRRLSTDEVPRLRVGVGAPAGGRDPADHVLSRFRKEEQPEIDIAIQHAADAVALWARDGIEECMNRFN